MNQGQKASEGSRIRRLAGVIVSPFGQPTKSPVVVIIAKSALKEIQYKLTHVDVEKVRQILAEKALSGAFVEKSVPLLSLEISDKEISRAVTIQYFIQNDLGKWDSKKVCIVAIDPQDENNPVEDVHENETKTLTKDAMDKPEKSPFWRNQAVSLLGELQKQGVALGVREIIRWMAGGMGG
jgi:hypothetical protein